MSSEIIPVQEDSASSSTKDSATSPSIEIIPVQEAQHQHSSGICTIQPWDLLDSRRVFNVEVSTQLSGGDHHTNQYLASEKGHKYVKLFNPTLASVKPLLDKIKEPSVLLFRGCEFLLQSPGFPFEKFKSITTLEISGFPHLATLPENTISQMTQLQSLNLSNLQINHLPDDLFENSRKSLLSLVIRGCSNLLVLPEPPQLMTRLENLDLSYLPIENLPGRISLRLLRSLILRGCSKLQSLPSIISFQLEFLDLCYCTSLIEKDIFFSGTSTVIDLSHTAFSWCNLPADTAISHLFFRNAKLCNPEKSFSFWNTIKVCDLSGNQGLQDVSKLEICRGLEALNLSRTAIQSIKFLSKLTYLRTLVLRECTRLKQLATVEQLENLEVLDLSGCEILCYLPRGLCKQRRMKELHLRGCQSLRELGEGLFDDMPSLEKLDLSNTNIKNLPSFANLINRGTVVNHSCDSKLESVPMELSNLMNLCSDNVDSLHEFHIVSTFISNSGFDKFKYRFTELNRYLLFLEEKINRSMAETEASALKRQSRRMRDVEKEAAGVKMQFDSMRGGLGYILGKIDLLESSQNGKSSEELLHQLMNYDYDNYDDDDSSILKKILRTVAKLKLLVPPTPPPSTKPDEKGTNKEGRNEEGTLFTKRKKDYHDGFNYDRLTTIEKRCLLYFECLTMALSGEKSIKEQILIHLWYGEGFLDPLIDAKKQASTSNTDTDNVEELYRLDAKERALTRNTNNANNTIMEIGRDILNALEDEEFIYPKRKSMWCLLEPDISFVIKKAMEEQWFDFNKRGKLTPHFGVSGRALLLKSAIDHPPSSRVWLNHTKTSEQLESFKAVRTLLYIDDPVVDINTKWFSSMTDLHVLQLVNLDSKSEQINIVDLEFLEELKRMKRLRLLNLESFAAIQKLPDSICQLTNLGILNLAYCSNLMELPTDIASLTNLIILDLTQCHILSELPKGLASLSKLEVLKGFPVTYEVSGKQSRKACTLRELLRLERLKKLNLVVNRDSFPDTMDLQVLRHMKELHNLKITWHPSIYKEEEVEKGALRQSRWKQFKCWGPQPETEEVEDELVLTNSCFGNLNKLVLFCFPFETEPNWLNPTEMQNLQRLYIVGGSLRTLFQDNTDQIRWNVKTLKLKYLSNLCMDWLVRLGNFPCLTSCDEYGCPHTQNFYEFYHVLQRRAALPHRSALQSPRDSFS